ncbi:nucleolar protein 12-domain-containing protein [Xylariomycetidae sp. FL0641]|nr:nucleolar protein 12-domain-containing protein [Xylariomycetidae sp. FL0641]
MFAKPRPKKVVAPPPKRRKTQHKVEEITFDDSARSEYLTGFHKRKLQRVKNAQEQAEKRARQEKIDFRKQAEERKREAEQHIETVNAMLKEAEHAGYVGGDQDESGDEAEEWGGFQDTPAAPEPVDHEEEYIDEERYTTVTVESVNVSRDGLTSSKPEDEEDLDEEGDHAKAEASDKQAVPSKNHPPKKKKQKFRQATDMSTALLRHLQRNYTVLRD